MTRIAAAWEGESMKTKQHPIGSQEKTKTSRSAMRGFISAQAAIVLAVIAAGGGFLAYEWHSAHHAKDHHGMVAKHQHHKSHDAKTTATN